MKQTIIYVLLLSLSVPSMAVAMGEISSAQSDAPSVIPPPKTLFQSDKIRSASDLPVIAPPSNDGSVLLPPTQQTALPATSKPSSTQKLRVWEICSKSDSKYYEGTLLKQTLRSRNQIGDKTCSIQKTTCPPVSEYAENGWYDAQFKIGNKQVRVIIPGKYTSLENIKPTLKPGEHYAFCAHYKNGPVYEHYVIDQLESLIQEQ